MPGFSTNTEVTEYSGRGVGMDVVKKSVEELGGNVTITSELGKGMTTTIRIPLTMAIMDGMEVSVGIPFLPSPSTTSARASRCLKAIFCAIPWMVK